MSQDNKGVTAKMDYEVGTDRKGKFVRGELHIGEFCNRTYTVYYSMFEELVLKHMPDDVLDSTIEKLQKERADRLVNKRKVGDQ